MGALGSLGSAGISAGAQMAMQSQMLDNYWQQIARQAEMDRQNYATQRTLYNADFGENWTMKLAEAGKKLFQDFRTELDAKRGYEGELANARETQTDAFGQRKYVPGQGFQYRFRDDIARDLNRGVNQRAENIRAAQNLSSDFLPQAMGDFARRTQYTPEGLTNQYRQEQDLAAWKQRQDTGKALHLAAARGGNRSNFKDQLADALQPDMRERMASALQARRQAQGDAEQLNSAADQRTGGRIAQLLQGALMGEKGLQYMDHRNQQMNPSGIQAMLGNAIGNVGNLMQSKQNYKSSYPAWEMRQTWNSDMFPLPGMLESRPTLGV